MDIDLAIISHFASAYVIGWCFGYAILIFKQFMEKI